MSRHARGSEVSMPWNWFCSRVLGTLVQTQGVRTYELLTSQLTVDDTTRTLLGNLDDLPSNELKLAAKHAIASFFASPDVAVRDYVLRWLHAHLLSLAVGLPAKSLDAIQGTRRKNVQLKLLLDTNFLFSILGLHENPANEAAEDLVNLLAAVKGKVSATLYVTPLTLDEVKRTLTSYQSKLNQIQVTPKLGEVASGIDGEFSGIARKYFEAAKRVTKRLTIADYFGPYLRDLLTVLRARGIQLYNENLDKLSASQPVIDDILEQQTFQESRQKKLKSYEALRHDVTLWHLVASRRPARLDAPLDATYWVATVDYRLLAFDLHKRRRRDDSVPVCVHPATLVQMLQLWLPRSSLLDAALFESLRATIPHSFDADAEEMSLKILRALSRYEDIDDLPESLLTSILMNQALRARMRAEKDVDTQVALIRDEIVQAAEAAHSDLRREKARTAELKAELQRIGDEAGKDVATASDAVGKADRNVQQLQDELDAERETIRQLEERLGAIEGELASERSVRAAAEDLARDTRVRHWFVVLSLVLLVGLAAASCGG